MKDLSLKTHKVNEIYEIYHTLFSSFFHTVLWKIIIDETHKNKRIAFTPICGEGKNMQLVIADAEGGYIPTICTFKDDIMYNTACTMCNALSSHVFGITKEEAEKIITESKRKKTNGNAIKQDNT